MGAGGSAEAMKFSDVLILVGIGMLCAGFIIHGWVEKTSIYEDDPEDYQKSVHLISGDKLIININAVEDSEGLLILSQGSTELLQRPFTLQEGESYEERFDSDEYDEYTLEIIIQTGSVEADVDISRAFMLDFIIYPISIGILLFGLQKRRSELANVAVDAELELKE